MTNARTAQMMGDPPHRTAAIADVLAELAAAPQRTAELEAAAAKELRPERRRVERDEIARNLWDDGYSIGRIAKWMNVSFSQAYEWIAGHPPSHPPEPYARKGDAQ